MNRLRFVLIGAACSLLLQLFAGLLGMPGMLLNFLVPVPLVYAAMRQGLAVGTGAALLAGIGTLAVGGPNAGLAFVMQYALPAVVIAGLLRKGIPWDRSVLWGTLVIALLATAGLLIYGARQGIDLPTMVDQYVQGEVASALQLAEQGDLDAGQTEEFRAVVEQMGRFLKVTFPAWGVLVTAIMLGLQVVFLGRLSRGRFVIPGPALARWKAPELLIWPLIFAGFGVIFGGGTGRLVAMNALVLLLPIYFLQGLAVISYYFAKKDIPSFLRGLGYLLIAVLNPLPIIVTGIGVFDMWADFRKPRQKKTER